MHGPVLEDEHVVVIIMGVSGAGKTTVGSRLAVRLGWRFLDADDVHPEANVAKMRAGRALDDEDRAPWLLRLRERVEAALTAGEGLVLACSALRAPYREVLTVDPGRQRWVYLHASRELLAQRLAARQGHYMPPALLDSQLAALELPEAALAVDVAAEPDTVVETIVGSLGLQKPA